MSTNRFSERDTERFYDAEDALYRSFWDMEGSLHWGLFDETTGDDFLKACVNLNRMMALEARIDDGSHVLDLGCGNGNSSIWLSQEWGCRVTGIDLSGVRINNARADLSARPESIRERVRFEKCSATDLPFEDGFFSHVWSQAAIYHVPDKKTTLEEAYRVLKPGGLMVFDDLIKPKPDISADAQRYVYDRLLFDTDYSFQGYQEALEKTGFQVEAARDLSSHLRRSYQHLRMMASQKKDLNPEALEPLAAAYTQMAAAIEADDLGWAFYVGRK